MIAFAMLVMVGQVPIGQECECFHHMAQPQVSWVCIVEELRLADRGPEIASTLVSGRRQCQSGKFLNRSVRLWWSLVSNSTG